MVYGSVTWENEWILCGLSLRPLPDRFLCLISAFSVDFRTLEMRMSTHRLFVAFSLRESGTVIILFSFKFNLNWNELLEFLLINKSISIPSA
jgi:hypothetical protein